MKTTVFLCISFTICGPCVFGVHEEFFVQVDNELGDFLMEHISPSPNCVTEERRLSFEEIDISAPGRISSTAVHIDLALKNLQLKTIISELSLKADYRSLNENEVAESGQIEILLYNVSMSGIVGVSNSETVPSVKSLYVVYCINTANIVVTRQGNISTKAVIGEQNLTRLLKSYLDIFITVQLNEILQEKASSNELSIRHLSTTGNKIKMSGNEIVDDLLTVLKKKMQNTMNIPDINISFNHGYLRTWSGWFEGLRSLHRTSDVTVSEQGDVYTMSSGFSLSQANVGFNYEAKYSIFKANGKATGSVGYNSISIQVSIDISDVKCSVGLDYFKVNQLNDLGIKVTGFGPFNGLVSKIATNQLNKHKGSIISNLESKMSDYIRNYLNGYDCNNIMGRKY